MRYRIHGKYSIEDEAYDSLDIEADTIEELREIAKKQTEIRSWTCCWSEEID